MEVKLGHSNQSVELPEICFNVVVEVKPVHQVIDDDVDKILSYDKVMKLFRMKSLPSE